MKKKQTENNIYSNTLQLQMVKRLASSILMVLGAGAVEKMPASYSDSSLSSILYVLQQLKC